MVALWDPFVDGAPDHWREDGWLQSVVSMAVVMRYGQDRLMCDYLKLDEEVQVWRQEHDYSKIRIVSLAIASSLRYVSLLAY
jgi:hypothetical protein